MITRAMLAQMSHAFYRKKTVRVYLLSDL